MAAAESPSSGPDVSVIVPARDAAATIGDTLAALSGQRFDGRSEVIVVDNGSIDETASIARRFGVRVVERQRGEGPSAARNAGVQVAGAPLLAFTDADCEPTADWLAAGARALAHADIVQGAVSPRPGGSIGPFDRTVWVRGEGLYETANLFVRREWWDRAGGFRELLSDGAEGAPFGEDAWFGWRVRDGGARSAFAPDAVVHHAVFRRRAGAFIADRWRLERFPALTARVPELRAERFYARWFLSRRTAALDAALVGGTVALLTGRRELALCAAPYAAFLARDAARWGPRLAPRVALASLGADLVGAAALVRGSWRWRTLVL